jgi:hypothetical protein
MPWLDVGNYRRIAIAKVSQKMTILRVCYSSHGGLLTEDCQDDASTDSRVGKKVSCVFGLVQRLLWQAGGTLFAGGVCQRTVVGCAPQNGRSDRVALWDGTSNVTAFS